jgi:hypothetical protein
MPPQRRSNLIPGARSPFDVLASEALSYAARAPGEVQLARHLFFLAHPGWLDFVRETRRIGLSRVSPPSSAQALRQAVDQLFADSAPAASTGGPLETSVGSKPALATEGPKWNEALAILSAVGEPPQSAEAPDLEAWRRLYIERAHAALVAGIEVLETSSPKAAFFRRLRSAAEVYTPLSAGVGLTAMFDHVVLGTSLDSPPVEVAHGASSRGEGATILTVTSSRLVRDMLGVLPEHFRPIDWYVLSEGLPHREDMRAVAAWMVVAIVQAQRQCSWAAAVREWNVLQPALNLPERNARRTVGRRALPLIALVMGLERLAS